MKNKVTKEKIIIILIIIIAIFSRTYQWPNTINGINCDEAMTAINAKSIAETGKDIYGTSLPVYFETWLVSGQSALLTYLIALCIKIFGFSIFSVRLPMLLMSIWSLYVFYKLVKLIFNDNKIAIISLFIVAINPWHIMQSQWALDCNTFPHFMLFSIYVLVKGFKQGKTALIYLSMILFGVTTYSYGISLYFIPIFLSILMISAIKNKKIRFKQVVICAIIVILVTLPLILMSFINLLGMDSIKIGPITIQNFRYNVRTNDMLIFSDNIIAQLFKNLRTLLKLLILNYDGLVFNAIPYIGTIYMGSIILVVLGICKLCKKESKKIEYKNVILIWIIIAIIVGVLINDININRINIIWYPMIMLIGFGIYTLLDKCKFDKKMITIIIVFYMVMYILFNMIFHTSHHEEIENSWVWSQGLEKAIKDATDTEKQIVLDESIGDIGKNVILSIYAIDYKFEEYGFIPKGVLINTYILEDNSELFQEVMLKNNIQIKKIEIKEEDFEKTYITNSRYGYELEDNLEYEIKYFNSFCVITKKE